MPIHKVFTKTILIIMTCLGLLGLLASFVFGSIAVGKARMQSPSVAVPYVSWDGGESIPSALRPFDLGDRGFGMIDSIRLETRSELTIADELHATSWLMTFLIPGLACLLIVVLSILLFRQRPFGLFTGISLMILGALTAVTGLLQPAFEAWAEQDVVRALGLPTDGMSAQQWVVPAHHDWLQDTYWFSIFLGVIIILGGVLALRARSLFTDLEGTI